MEDKLIDQFDLQSVLKYYTKWIEDDKMPRGRPKKLKLPSELADVSIVPALNGYMITSTTTGKQGVFVFEDLDKAFEFIKKSLKPTGEQAQFLDNV